MCAISLEKRQTTSRLDKIAIFFYLLSFIGITASYLLNNDYIRIITIIINLLFLLVTDVGHSLAHIAFLTSYATIFKIKIGTPSCVSYFMVIFLIKCILKRHKIRINDLIIWLLFLIYTILITINSGYEMDFIQFHINLLLFLLVYSNLEVYSNCWIINFSFVFGVLTASISAKILFNLPSMQMIWKEAYVYGVRRFSGLEYDPNFYSVILLVAISICLIFVIREKSWFYGFSAVVLTGIGFSTLSKMFLIGLLIILLFTLIDIRKQLSLIRYIGVIFLIVAIGVIILYKIETDGFERNKNLSIVLDRISKSSSIDDLFTTRIQKQLTYLKLISSNIKVLLFGYGFNSNNIFLQGINYSAHNTYLQITFYTGIIGLFILISYFVSIFNSLKRRMLSYSNLTLVITLVVMFVLDLTYKEFVPIIFCISLINGAHVSHVRQK